MAQQKQAGAARRNKSDGRLDHLLDMAAEVFREQGYEATTIGEIARRAHASKDTFYKHFPTKVDLFKAVALRRAQPIGDNFRDILCTGAPVEKTLLAFGNTLLDVLLSPESIDRHRVIYMESKRFPVVGREFYEAAPMRVHGLLSAYLEERQRAGELKLLDAAIAAEQFIDMISANFLRKLLLGVLEQTAPEDRGRRIGLAVDLFMAGYASSKRSVQVQLS